MPKKREFTVYSFRELSKKAQERAIEDYRKHHETFDQIDADFLTDQFKQDLKEYYELGDNFEVYWSLGYCQGDGVCFNGRVDVERFIKKEKAKEFYPLIGLANALISNPSRSCHYNSMQVDVVVEGGPDQFWDKKTGKEHHDWFYKSLEIDQRNGRKIREHREAVNAIKSLYEENLREYQERRGTGPKAWIPEPPPIPPKPEDFPPPPELLPELPMPGYLKTKIDAAEEEWKKTTEKLVPDFEFYLAKRVREISRKMEEAGYKEIEYHSSDEYIRELLENQDWEYLEDGERFES